MPGVLPKRNPQRTNSGEWRTLPRSGRSGEPPPWPIGQGDTTVLELWRDLWASPQAAAWEDLGWIRLIARYALKVLQAEDPDSPVALSAEVRQLEDRLGLNPPAMKRLRWELAPVVADHVGQPSQGMAEVVELDGYRDL